MFVSVYVSMSVCVCGIRVSSSITFYLSLETWSFPGSELGVSARPAGLQAPGFRTSLALDVGAFTSFKTNKARGG